VIRLTYQAIDVEQRERDEQRRQRLRHDEPVVRPKVRVQRGDAGGDPSGAVPREPARQQTDDDDRGRPEHRHREPLRDQRLRRHERHRRQDDHGQRGMVRGGVRPLLDLAPGDGLRVERLEEPVAPTEAVGLGVVEELVAVDRLVRLREGDVRDAQHERNQRDQQQETPEPPIVAFRPRHGDGAYGCRPVTDGS
jgi:hypothetical protein